MQVQDLFARLSFGELANLAIGMEGTGEIAEASRPRVLTLLNNALTALYTRFPHQREFLSLTIIEGQEVYVMGDSVIKILGVTRQDDPLTPLINEEAAMGINALGSPLGVRLVNHKTLRFREPKAGEVYEIEYQANHPRVELMTDELLVMPGLEEALQCRIAAGILSGMNGPEHTAKGTELMTRYEALCQEAQSEDLAQEGSSDHRDRLRDKGFI